MIIYNSKVTNAGNGDKLIYNKPESYNPDRLSTWINDQNKSFKDESGNLRWETDPEVTDSIANMFRNTGYRVDTKSKDKSSSAFKSYDDGEFYRLPWSGATVSNLVMALTGKDKDNIKGFRPALAHNSYITDAFKSSKDKDFKYNMYKPEQLKSNNEDGTSKFGKYDVGDILFRGRGNSSSWDYNKFQAAATNNKKYASHSDMITGKGKDSYGTYHEITGGNRGNKAAKERSTDKTGETGGVFSTSKLYYDENTGEIIKGGKNTGPEYKGAMRFNDYYKPKSDISRVKSKPMKEVPTIIGEDRPNTTLLRYSRDNPVKAHKLFSSRG